MVTVSIAIVRGQRWWGSEMDAFLRTRVPPRALQNAQGELISLLRDPDDQLRAIAAGLLAKLPQKNGRVIVALASVLRDKHWAVRKNAASGLWDVDTQYRAVIPALIVLLGDYDESVRHAARQALFRIQERSGMAIDELLIALQSSTPRIRAGTAETLREFEKEKERIVPALRERLTDIDEESAHQAAVGLWKLTNDPRPVIEHRFRALREGFDREEWNRVLFWRDLAPRPVAAVPILTEYLQHADAQVRRQSARLLGELGENSKASIPTLERALANDADPSVREAAETALGRVSAQ